MKIIKALLCDDVRREDTGKLLIIGVYTNNIGVPHFPSSIALTLWVHLSAAQKERIDIEIRIRDKNDPKKILNSGKGTIKIEHPSQDIFAAIPSVLLNLRSTATLIFEIREGGGRWMKALEIPVTTESLSA